MKLSKVTALAIENILSTVKLIKVAELLITNDKVSGYNPDKTAFVLSDLSLTDDFGEMGINRLQTFLSRFNLIKDDDNAVITAEIDGVDDDKFVKQMNFKSKALNIQYRCGPPKFIASPKVVHDNEEFIIKIDEDLSNLISKASGTSDSDRIKLINVNGELTYELVDNSNDIIKIEAEDKVEVESDGSNNFTFSYALDMFNSLMKGCAEATYSIGKRGIFKIKVNGLTIYMLPRV